ncbi:PAS domain-containing sensor histidine kinase, partial [Paraburkholderia sp. SIMBA_009]
MVLKNLIKARKAHEQTLSDDAQLVSSGLLPGFEALPTVVLVLEKRTLRVVFANPSPESMLELSRRQLTQMAWPDIFTN